MGCSRTPLNESDCVVLGTVTRPVNVPVEGLKATVRRLLLWLIKWFLASIVMIFVMLSPRSAPLNMILPFVKLSTPVPVGGGWYWKPRAVVGRVNPAG